MEPTLKLIEIARLLARKKESLLNADEEKILQKWADEDPANAKMLQQVINDDTLATEIEQLDKIPYQQAFQKSWEQIQKNTGEEKIPFIRRSWRYAASIVLLLGTTFSIYYGLKIFTGNAEIADISGPGASKAILITGDKEEIVLGDTTTTINMIAESGVSISDSASVLRFLTYDTLVAQDMPNELVKINTLITPLGGEYSLLLADGTEIMLNSGSRLTFPDKFSGDVREVSLEGEAYFRVAKNQKKFVVNNKNMNAVVYGTEFNLSVYNDEPELHATLLEGSIGVSLANNSQEREYILSPGEQLKLENRTGNIVLSEVDTDLVTAWTRNMFRFDNKELGYILMKLAKWYNFDYRFDDASLSQRSFTCDLMKYDDITPILELISRASDIEFTVSRNTLVVKEEEK